jgi:hypothetical protein
MVATSTFPLDVRKAVNSADGKMRKWIALGCRVHGSCLEVNVISGWSVLARMGLTESLDV